MTFLRTIRLTCNPEVGTVSPIRANWIWGIIFHVQCGSDGKHYSDEVDQQKGRSFSRFKRFVLVRILVRHLFLLDLYFIQCDQIGQFIGLWATFQSHWQQLICPNLPHSIIVKVSKSFIFLVKSVLGNFSRHVVIYVWSHWPRITHWSHSIAQPTLPLP